MRLLPVLAVAIVLGEVAGAVVFAASGSWLLAALLFAAAVAVPLLVGLTASRASRRRPVAPGYVERETHSY